MTAPSVSGKVGGTDLLARSLEVLHASQAPTGAYLAAPAFSQYGYCWLRDGAFIAQAMDVAGEHASAAAFHAWVARTISRYRHKVERLEQHRPRAAGDGRQPYESPAFEDDEILHARFTAEGEEHADDWGNFQLDGYGFWLSSLVRHLVVTGAGPGAYAEAVDLVVRYLALLWDRPCYDCWEEYPGRRHSTTWAAVAAGLRAAGGLLDRPDAVACAEDIMARLRRDGVRGGVLRKFTADAGPSHAPASEHQSRGRRAVAGHERAGKPLPPDALDGSALLVMGPLGPFDRTDPIVRETVLAVERQLVADGGGVHRYAEDEYYGGGLWVLLTSALADVSRRLRVPARAGALLRWVEEQADPEGHLPEQVPRHLRHPELLQPWLGRWGPPAIPLAWSHAMYLIARLPAR
jgi:GH15 family glucan-1,4-alpha-glucosidase